jgi:hypothetical protein
VNAYQTLREFESRQPHSVFGSEALDEASVVSIVSVNGNSVMKVAALHSSFSGGAATAKSSGTMENHASKNQTATT